MNKIKAKRFHKYLSFCQVITMSWAFVIYYLEKQRNPQ